MLSVLHNLGNVGGNEAGKYRDNAGKVEGGEFRLM